MPSKCPKATWFCPFRRARRASGAFLFFIAWLCYSMTHFLGVFLLCFPCPSPTTLLLLVHSYRWCSLIADAVDKQGRTALMMAVAIGASECVDALCQLGTEASSIIDSFGQTALHIALRHSSSLEADTLSTIVENLIGVRVFFLTPVPWLTIFRNTVCVFIYYGFPANQIFPSWND